AARQLAEVGEALEELDRRGDRRGASPAGPLDARVVRVVRAVGLFAEEPVEEATHPATLTHHSSRRGCSSLATRPVHPVWCEAPTPRPVSPWKYSWNNRLSRNAGSSRWRVESPKTGRRPVSSLRNSRVSRRDNSAATWSRLR